MPEKCALQSCRQPIGDERHIHKEPGTIAKVFHKAACLRQYLLENVEEIPDGTNITSMIGWKPKNGTTV